MKAWRQPLTKKAVSNAKRSSFRRAFLGVAAETKFSLQVSGNQVVQQKISESGPEKFRQKQRCYIRSFAIKPQERWVLQLAFAYV